MTFRNPKYFDLSPEKVMENRVKWIEFLKDMGTRKITGKLDDSEGGRCCLGHGCYAIGIPGIVAKDETGKEMKSMSYGDCTALAPAEFINAVGLYDESGRFAYNEALNIQGKNIRTLAGMNDKTTMTPQEIGAWLEERITGHEKDSPFKVLTDE
jgi:hypothetical protein